MKKKITAIALIVAILAVGIIGGTLAYFTDTTKAKVNTFTVGNVDITLTEPKWDEDGDAARNLMPGNSYAKDPTITVVEGSQDCWVFMEVQMNKFNSWLRLVAQQNDSENLNLFDFVDDCEKCAAKYDSCQGHLNAEGLATFFRTNAYQDALDEWFGGVKHNEWQIMNWEEVWQSIQASWTDSSIKLVNPIFGYKTTLKAGQSATLFEKITMPADITSEQLEYSRFNTAQKNWELTITGYAIQAENLDTLSAAYAALFTK